MKEDPVSRRSFLTRTALPFGGAASVAGGCALLGKRGRRKNVMLTLGEDNLRINPAFRSIIAAEGRLELLTYLASGERLSHTFSHLEAGLLSALQSRSHATGIVAPLATRYGMSEAKCRH